jgi:hypothetical protein
VNLNLFSELCKKLYPECYVAELQLKTTYYSQCSLNITHNMDRSIYAAALFSVQFKYTSYIDRSIYAAELLSVQFKYKSYMIMLIYAVVLLSVQFKYNISYMDRRIHAVDIRHSSWPCLIYAQLIRFGNEPASPVSGSPHGFITYAISPFDISTSGSRRPATIKVCLCQLLTCQSEAGVTKIAVYKSNQ